MAKYYLDSFTKKKKKKRSKEYLDSSLALKAETAC